MTDRRTITLTVKGVRHGREVAISGNLCRCTGYQGIVAAALDAARSAAKGA